MKRPRVTLPATALAVSLGAVALLQAADRGPAAPGVRFTGDVERAAELIREKKILSVGQALTCVPKQAHGQLIQVTFREKSDEAGGRAIYEVYVLPEDRLVRVVVLEASSGEVLLQRRLGHRAREGRHGGERGPVAAGTRLGGDVERAAELIREKKIVSVGQALTCVPKQARGQLLQVTFRETSEEADGRPVYEVYVLSEDRLVRVTVLDAASGNVLVERRVGVSPRDR